jgi:hypothetical protein
VVGSGPAAAPQGDGCLGREPRPRSAGAPPAAGAGQGRRRCARRPTGGRPPARSPVMHVPLTVCPSLPSISTSPTIRVLPARGAQPGAVGTREGRAQWRRRVPSAPAARGTLCWTGPAAAGRAARAAAPVMHVPPAVILTPPRTAMSEVTHTPWFSTWRAVAARGQGGRCEGTGARGATWWGARPAATPARERRGSRPGPRGRTSTSVRTTVWYCLRIASGTSSCGARMGAGGGGGRVLSARSGVPRRGGRRGRAGGWAASPKCQWRVKHLSGGVTHLFLLGDVNDRIHAQRVPGRGRRRPGGLPGAGAEAGRPHTAQQGQHGGDGEGDREIFAGTLHRIGCLPRWTGAKGVRHGAVCNAPRRAGLPAPLAARDARGVAPSMG